MKAIENLTYKDCNLYQVPFLIKLSRIKVEFIWGILDDLFIYNFLVNRIK